MFASLSKKDVNPIGLIGEFTAATAPGPIAITPDIFGRLPRAATTSHLGQHTQAMPAPSHHAFINEHQQTILDHYGGLINGNCSQINVGIANIGDDCHETSQQVQHFDIGVGGNDGSTAQQQFDDGEDGGDDGDEDAAGIDYNQHMVDACTGDDNSIDMADQYDDDDEGDEEMEGNGTSCDGTVDGNNGNSLNYQSFDAVAALQATRSASGRLTHKTKTKSTQTNRKIKPIKRPGLVLKTPIAYQPCLDPSVIPIQRDGMGTFVLFFHFVF